MSKKSLNKICIAYEDSTSSEEAANLMYDIAREALSKIGDPDPDKNIFIKLGEFLLEKSVYLDERFEEDYSYGSASLIPNVPKFIWSEFQKYNRGDH